MSPEFKIKPFKTLSLVELYQILQLRSEVFVVEQNCVYQDIDGNDEKALHVLGMHEGVLVAYARLFQPGDYFEQASIGIQGIAEHYGETNITISAQLYLKRFYESHGFVQTSDMYLEDDIPHIEMKRG